MPLVSIIMNVRNGERFLGEALESVLAQTFTDWELIAWDDCSTDNSAAIVQGFQDRRIRYFLAPEHTSLGRARELAIQQAQGEWLAFLDQDDIWLPRKLERQMALAGDGVGIIYGRAMLFDSRHGDLRDYDYFHAKAALPEGNIFANLFSEACFIAMSSAVLRRSAVLELGGIPTSIEVVPDYFLYVAIAHNYHARAVQDVVCRYRVHIGSMSASREHRLRLHEEPLMLLEYWAPALDPRIVAYRRMTHSTALAFEELKDFRSAGRGLYRLLADGSVAWLVSRPAALAWRSLQRKRN